MDSLLIARWESRGGTHVAELWKATGSGYYTESPSHRGYLGNDISEAQAIALMESRCSAGAGFYHPGKTAMRRVS